MHRGAPFLFFNGNTFAAIGRQMSAAVFAELPPARRREVISAVGHYIAGVLDWGAFAEIVEGMIASGDFQPGMKVRTVRGSTRGTILRILNDGRVVWLPEGASMELIGMPDSLLLDS
jgi:hypothetical protein